MVSMASVCATSLPTHGPHFSPGIALKSALSPQSGRACPTQNRHAAMLNLRIHHDGAADLQPESQKLL
jgi:hypothetical protein